MPIAGSEEALKELLNRCTVKIHVGSGWGTGFFVAPRVIITSYHVVKDAITKQVPVMATTFDGRPFAATVRADGFRGPGWPDVAILDVAADDLPCVVFDTDQVPGEARLFTGGYPSESSVVYQTKLLVSGGEQNYDVDSAGVRRPNLRLNADTVVGGMSGGAVVNLNTGFVCGVVRLTIDARYPVGGFATPMSSVLAELPILRGPLDRPGPAAKAWIDLLGPIHLRDFRRNADGARWDAEERTRRVDLNLERDDAADSLLTEWRVATPSAPVKAALVRGSDLGAMVMEAVERWSQRRTLGTNKFEADLLGQMLYRALLPKKIEALVEKESLSANQVLVRVHVKPGSRLAKIPWEYTLKPDASDTVATKSSMAFSRYVDAKSASIQLQDSARVLVVVERPREFWDRPPLRALDYELDPPHRGSQITADLLSALDRSGRFYSHSLTDVPFDEVTDVISEQGPWDIIHYVGVGWDAETENREPTLGFSGTSEQTPLPSVMSVIAGHARCRLVVVQLLSVPPEVVRIPIGPLALLPLISGGVQALVVGQHAASLAHILGFSQRFYTAIAAGDAVEFAVQKARARMRASPPDLDYTAFGTVTVTTTEAGELRLLTRATNLVRDSSSDRVGARSTSKDPQRSTGPTLINRDRP
jgi:hypothetical protein